MNRVARNRAAGLALAGAIVLIDQLVKTYLLNVRRLAQIDAIEILPFFDLRFTRNLGVSLGMFTAQSDGQRWVLIAVTGMIALAVLVWLLRERVLADILALGLVLGGALGNICDRYVHGYVVDYADLHFGTFRPFLIFNIADAAITIGVVLILARSFFSRDKRPGPDAQTPIPFAPESSHAP